MSSTQTQPVAHLIPGDFYYYAFYNGYKASALNTDVYLFLGADDDYIFAISNGNVIRYFSSVTAKVVILNR